MKSLIEQTWLQSAILSSLNSIELRDCHDSLGDLPLLANLQERSISLLTLKASPIHASFWLASCSVSFQLSIWPETASTATASLWFHLWSITQFAWLTVSQVSAHSILLQSISYKVAIETSLLRFLPSPSTVRWCGPSFKVREWAYGQA